MPIVDVLRIKIEKIDKYTHLPLEGDEAEKYIIECNTSAELSPVYIGGNEIIYESDNSLVDYNIENFTMYGVNVVIQTATFSLKRHAFLTGGIFLDQDAIYPRTNLFGLRGYRGYINGQNGYDTNVSYPGVQLSGQYHRKLWNLVDGIPVKNTTYNTNAASRIVNGYLNLITYPSATFPTREDWYNSNKNSNIIPRVSGQGIFLLTSSTQNGYVPAWRDMVNGTTSNPPGFDVRIPASAKDVNNSWESALVPESDNVRVGDQSYCWTYADLWYNERQWRNEQGLNSSGMWTIFAQGIRAAYNGTGTIQSVLNTKYNFTFFFGWQTFIVMQDFYANLPTEFITKEQYKTMISDNIKVVVSLNPNFQQHYKAYYSYTATTDPIIPSVDFQTAIDTDEYLLDYFSPGNDERLWQGFPDVIREGVSVFTTGPIYGGNRLNYSYTYQDEVPIKLTVAFFLDMDAVVSSGYFNLPIAQGPVNFNDNWVDGRIIFADPVWFPRCEVAGQKAVTDVAYDWDWFNSIAEYEEELLQAGTEIPGVVPNTYYSPHSIAPNETDLFATTLYTRDFIGADVNQYYKLYMNNCFSDKQPGLTINQFFNDHEMHIYARDSFITVRPALEISPMTAEEYRQEIERDDST